MKKIDCKGVGDNDCFYEVEIKKDIAESNLIENIVDVTVIIFPDGGTHLTKNLPVFKDGIDVNQQYAKKCIQQWKKQNHEKYTKNPGLMGAVAQIRMLEKDYKSIKATDEFIE